MINFNEQGFTMFPNKARSASFWKHLPSRELYSYIIYDCAYKPTSYDGIQLDAGQTIIGTSEEIAEELDLTLQQIKTAFQKIEKAGAIKIEKISYGRRLITSLWNITQSADNPSSTGLQPVSNRSVTEEYPKISPQNQASVTVLQPVSNQYPINNQSINNQSPVSNRSVTEEYPKISPQNQASVTVLQPVCNPSSTGSQPVCNQSITKTPIVLKNTEYRIQNTEYNKTPLPLRNNFNNTACAGTCVREEGGDEENASEKRLRLLAEEIYKAHPKHGCTTNMMKIIETVHEDAGNPGMTLDMAFDKFETATKQYLEEVKSWDRRDWKYAIPLDRWCIEKRYHEDPAIWKRNSTKANGLTEGEGLVKHGYSFDPVNERGLAKTPQEIAMEEAIEESMRLGVTMSSLLPKFYAKHGVKVD